MPQTARPAGMTPSIATVCLSGTLREKLAHIAVAGFRHVEIFDNDLLTFDGSLDDLAATLRRHELEVVTLQPFRDFEGLSGRDRELAFARAEAKFDQMAVLDTDLLMLCSSCHPAAQPGIERIVADLRELGERAAARGLRIAYEALAWAPWVHDYRDAWEIVRRVDHPAVGLVLDTFHLFSRGSPLEPIAQIPGDRIFLVQTADAPRLSMDHLSWSRHYRCFPGQGELDIHRFMAQLSETGYSGPLSHEVFNDVFRMSDPAQTARDGYRSSRYLASMVPDPTNGVPQAQPLLGCEFIEISCEPEHLPTLQNTLTALGLARVGVHRQLDAEGWHGGGVRVVLNTDRAFAEHFLDKHGTSVVAIGLRTHNAYQMIRRAQALGLELVEPDSVDASHRMVALRNVDGTIWYLLDASAADESWASAFDTLDEPPNHGELNGVDHIQLSQSYADSLSTAFAFRSLFDLRPRPTFDVFDPRGLVQSQVLDAAESAFRIALNTSQSRDTLSGSFRQQTGGSGVHHVAFGCTDVLAVARSLARSGVDTLSIPPNYYLDIQPRFGLSDAFVETLQEFNVLYDEDAHGRFLQLYTVPVAGSFCFEIVQRDGYQGMGEANAHVRTAAALRPTSGP